MKDACDELQECLNNIDQGLIYTTMLHKVGTDGHRGGVVVVENQEAEKLSRDGITLYNP